MILYQKINDISNVCSFKKKLRSSETLLSSSETLLSCAKN
jgi:hypothetical protein